MSKSGLDSGCSATQRELPSSFGLGGEKGDLGSALNATVLIGNMVTGAIKEQGDRFVGSWLSSKESLLVDTKRVDGYGNPTGKGSGD